MTKQVGNILLVEVPDLQSSIDLSENTLSWITTDNGWPRWETLPPGDWQLLRSCTSDQLTEEDCEKLIERQGSHGKFIDYQILNTSLGKYGVYVLATAKESLHSLVRSQGMKPETTVVLFKNDKT